MTVLVDCATQMTKKLDRTITARVATDGLILTGVQLVEGESFFVGDLQQLLIADTPDEAYNLCTKYSPGCTAGFSSTRFTSEVSGGGSISSSAEVSRSSSSSSSFSSGSASRTSSSGSGGASSSGSSRYDVNLSRERAYGSTAGGQLTTSDSRSSQSSGQSGASGVMRENIQSGAGGQAGSRGQSGASGVITENIQTGAGGQGGSRGQLSEIREDIYGLLEVGC